MNSIFVVILLLRLFLIGKGWPRYGRPHPLYGNQARGDVLADAVLLGLDFNEIPSVHAISDQGSGNESLSQFINHGFPMNAREQRIARTHLGTLDTLGVLEGVPEGFTLPAGNAGQDVPDSPGQGNRRNRGRGTNRGRFINASNKRNRYKQRKTTALPSPVTSTSRPTPSSSGNGQMQQNVSTKAEVSHRSGKIKNRQGNTKGESGEENGSVGRMGRRRGARRLGEDGGEGL